MDPDSYQQYASESSNWLHRGRSRLIEGLIDRIAENDPVHAVLEVGAGVGQNLPMLAKYGTLDAAEIDPVGIEQIRQRDLVDHLYTDLIPFEMRSDYDVICALDVLEHLEHDTEALDWMASGLTPNGHVVVSVPAYQWLFGDHDRALGHYRRYTRRSLAAAFPPSLEVVHVGYFNCLILPVAAATRLVGRVRPSRGRSEAPKKQRSEVPGSIDRVLGGVMSGEAALWARCPLAPFGLSAFAVARRRL